MFEISKVYTIRLQRWIRKFEFVTNNQFLYKNIENFFCHQYGCLKKRQSQKMFRETPKLKYYLWKKILI